jgi:hypothetical protein
MKRLIVILSLILITSSVFASDDENIAAIAKEKFEKNFPGADFAKWKAIDDSRMYEVRFVYNKHGYIAYIDENGEMVATARRIEKENLPFLVSQAISKKYSQYRVREIEELIIGDMASYLVTVYSDKKILGLRVFNSGNISVIKRSKL